jgi:murein tripeptide amidase MpaA
MKRMSRTLRVLGAALLGLFAVALATTAMMPTPAAGQAPSQDSAKYHNYAELTAMAQAVAKANPQIVKLESFGKTLEKRDLWVLQIANPAGVPVGERPALLVAANFEADHLIGSELALYLADFLVKGYAANPAVKQRLDTTVVYIMPRINPDGAELMWAPVKAARRTNTRPYDDDNDGRVDEDGPVDLTRTAS